MPRPENPGTPPSRRPDRSPPAGRPDADGRRQVRDALERMARLKGKPCLLCKRPGAYIGQWFPSPEQAQRMLVAPGRFRVLGYTLCRACKADPGVLTRVEEHIFALYQQVGDAFGTN